MMSDFGETASSCDTHLEKSNTCRRRRGIGINAISSVCTFPAKRRTNFEGCNNELNLSIPKAKPAEIPVAASDGDAIHGANMNCESHGSMSVIGRRRAMEDAVTVVPAALGGAYDFFAVYDGHGGAKVANSCRDRMHKVVGDEVEKGDFGGDKKAVSYWEKVMRRCFDKMDEKVCGGVTVGDEEEGQLSEKTVGATALVVLVGEEVVVVANCGDSRAVLCRGGTAMALSSDHKPDRVDERARIVAAGGQVIDWHGSRILGVLGTSRSIGDQYLKPYVTSEPEVTVTERKESDEFIVIATDGLWDVISNEFACEVVKHFCGQSKNKRLSADLKGSCATEAAGVLAELAIAKGSKDNISVIVVELNTSM